MTYIENTAYFEALWYILFGIFLVDFAVTSLYDIRQILNFSFRWNMQQIH